MDCKFGQLNSFDYIIFRQAEKML